MSILVFVVVIFIDFVLFLVDGCGILWIGVIFEFFYKIGMILVLSDLLKIVVIGLVNL